MPATQSGDKANQSPWPSPKERARDSARAGQWRSISATLKAQMPSDHEGTVGCRRKSPRKLLAQQRTCNGNNPSSRSQDGPLLRKVEDSGGWACAPAVRLPWLSPLVTSCAVCPRASYSNSLSCQFLFCLVVAKMKGRQRNAQLINEGSRSWFWLLLSL